MGSEWTASLWVYINEDCQEEDAFLFTRYNEDRDEVVAIKLDNMFVEVTYNDRKAHPSSTDKLKQGQWHSVITRLLDGKVDLWIDGVLVAHDDRDDEIMDTDRGAVYIGVDAEDSDPSNYNNYLDGSILEV